jgi:hypothetical protein
MIKGEIEVGPAAVRTAVAERLEHGSVLGAYATDRGVRYLFIERHGIRVLSARVDSGEPVAAVSGTYPGLSWDEREMADEFGTAFDALPDARPFRPVNGELAPAVVATGPGVTQVVVGPVHAGIIEPGRFTFSSGGETIAHLDFHTAAWKRVSKARIRSISCLASHASAARAARRVRLRTRWRSSRLAIRALRIPLTSRGRSSSSSNAFTTTCSTWPYVRRRPGGGSAKRPGSD